MSNRYLLEAQYHTGSSLETLRLSTGQGYQTKLSETPSRATYLPLIKDAGNINSFLFDDASLEGFSEIGLGKIVLNNADGTLSYLEDMGLGGFGFNIREEKGETYPDNFPVRIAGAIDNAEFDSLEVGLIVKDMTSLFRDNSYQVIKYLGTNNGTTIELEGTEDDIGGLPKPIALGGPSKNVSPVMVNEGKEIYQISSEPVAEIPAIYIGRATGTAIDTVHTSLTSFLADTVTVGQVNIYYGDYTAAVGTIERGCYIMMGTTPSHILTVDVIEGWKNLALYSEDFSNAVYTKTNITVSSNSAVSPDGNTTADTLTATAGNGTCLQALTASSLQYISGVWLKRKTGVGNVDITVDGGSHWETKTLTTDWQFFEVIPRTGADPSVGVRIVTNGDAVYAWGMMCCQRDECGPYVKTTSAAVYNNHIPALIWKIMDRNGYELDVASIAYAQAQFPYPAQCWSSPDEIKTGEIIDIIKDSGLFYLTNDIAGSYIVKQFTVPTSGENVKTYANSQILGGFGTPKIRKVTSKDSHKGVPVWNVNIGYEQNYTKMTKEQLTGIADTTEELAYVKLEFRTTNDDDDTVLIKYPNSPEVNKDTKLVDKTGGDAFATLLLNMLKVLRRIIEIKVPTEFTIKTNGDIIQKGEVIQVDSKYYRIIGQKARFPSTDRKDVSAAAITYQGWGGVS